MEEHFYVERFASIAIYAVVLLIVYNILSKDRANIKKVLWCYTICLSIMAYNFKPTSSMDLTRLWATAEYYSSFSFSELIKLGFDIWDAPLGLIYVCRLTLVNRHLVPAITAFVYYSNIFYIFYDINKNNEIKNASIAAVLFFFMSSGIYTELISDIRNLLAFSIIVRCIYSEIYRKKSIVFNLPFYLLASLFHSSAMVFTAIRFLVYIFLEMRGVKRIGYLLTLMFFVGIGYYYFGNNVTRAITKGVGYYENGGYSYFWEYLINILNVIVCCYLLLFSGRMNNITNEAKKYKILGIVIYLVCFIGAGSFSIFHRFSYLATMILIPFEVEIFNDSAEISNHNKRSILFVISCLLLFMSGLKGHLNGLKFF